MVKSGEFEVFKSHFPEEISQEIRDYATNDVMMWSRYLFTRREGKRQYAYCTHCRTESETKGLRHNHTSICPVCKSEAYVKGSGMGRQRMLDEAYLLYYEKSQVDPTAIIARGFYMTRDYRGSFHNVETQLKVTAMYLFKPGHTEMWSKNYYWKSDMFHKDANIRSQAVNEMRSKHCYYSIDSIRAAVKGTQFQYCTWEHYDYAGWDDRLKVFDLAAKYPCIEYLTKLGMSSIVISKLSGARTYGAINWQGKTLDKVLRLSKSEAKEWTKLPYKGGLLSLFAYQLFTKKMKLGFSFDQAHQLCSIADNQRYKDVEALSGYATPKRILLYILGQMKKRSSNRWHSSPRDILIDWKDYVGECEQLGIDLTQEHNLFPNNLNEAHQKTSAKVKVKQDEIVAQQIVKRASKLKNHIFEYGDFLVRPASSSQELFREGKELQHCVGSYAERYAQGKTDIFVVRRLIEPEKPFYTLEIRNGDIIQCRGYKNCATTEEVRAFIDMFKAKNFGKKKMKMEVAV